MHLLIDQSREARHPHRAVVSSLFLSDRLFPVLTGAGTI